MLTLHKNTQFSHILNGFQICPRKLSGYKIVILILILMICHQLLFMVEDVYAKHSQTKYDYLWPFKAMSPFIVRFIFSNKTTYCPEWREWPNSMLIYVLWYIFSIPWTIQIPPGLILTSHVSVGSLKVKIVQIEIYKNWKWTKGTIFFAYTFWLKLQVTFLISF